MDIRSFFSPSSKKKVINDEDDFVKVTRKKSVKRKGVLYDSDSSDENPIPKSVQKQLSSSNVIVDSDDERKNLQSKPKKKKGKTTEAPSKVLKKTTPNEFFGSNKSTKISKPVNKRKANDLEANKTKKPKHNKDDLIVIEDDESEILNSMTATNNTKSLSGKLALAAAKQNGESNAKLNSSIIKDDTKENSDSNSNKKQNVKNKKVIENSSSKRGKSENKTPQKIKTEINQNEKFKTKSPLNKNDESRSAEDVSSQKSSKTKVVKTEKTETKTPQKTTSKNKKTPSKNDSSDVIKTEKNTSQSKVADPKPTETSSSDKQARFLKFQKWQNRSGPSNPGSKEVPQGNDFCFEGLIFVITGIQESLDREEIKSLVERYGGKVTGSVSSRTSYLIAGSDPGESKIKKAEQHSTKMINEDEFLDLIRTLPGKKSKYEVSRNVVKAKSETNVKSKKTENEQEKTSASSSISTSSRNTSLMWVDKYKPNNIKQIIGQQGASSNVQKLLNWLKKWKFNNCTAEGRARPKPKITPWGGGDPTGASFKAALLSGPPGVGKTTSATLVCQELGLPYVELNASDKRSKKSLQEDVIASVQNTSLSNLFAGKGSHVSKQGSEHVLIMDEVDGMAGNEDRGGIQELIQIIKATKIPIICMCNDRSSPKIRSLVNHCFDLRFQRPRVEQITSSVMSICYKEKLEVQAPALQAIIRGCNQDVRQVLHNLSMLKASEASLSYDAAKSHASRTQKDVNLGVFDIARKLFSTESASLSLLDKSDLFFMDYSMVPKFIQENYINVSPFEAKGNTAKHLKLLSKAADSIADGDLIEACIRSDQSWSMLPTLGLLSTVLPCDFMRGNMQGMINFPSFFGKLSTTSKHHRLLQEIKFHSSLGTNGCSEQTVNLDLAPYLRWHLTQPLLRQSRGGDPEVHKVTQLLDDYDLTREDFDSLLEVGQFPGKVNYMSQVDSKVKASFTRTYNKESHLTPYAVESAAAKKKKKKAPSNDYEMEEAHEEDEASDGEDLGLDGMIKQSKKTSAKASKPRAKKSKASTAGTSRKKK